MQRWVGRVALVTGASVGIGAKLSEDLVKAGMTVVGCARNIEKIQKASEDLKSSNGSLYAIKCDLTKEDEILAMFNEIKLKFGGVDVCINNAGLAHAETLLTGSTEKWRNMLEVNVIGLSVCTREAVQSMRDRNVDDGHIIHVNSMSGKRIITSPAGHFYSASKFAVTALTEGLRHELRDLKSHIRVSSISPGVVETEFAERMTNTDMAAKLYGSMKCLETADISAAIIYALSAPPHVQVHDILMRPTEQVS
ncbi:unnamed protein product [Owenia fusiformis]|uniref:Uncharacterized protein n=1 Tax=Owenia fusiformis TaxID=6347 RepID=A0A8J1TWW9_OWEFU|nr:unnamed protein product [Owenia fusiformis]